MNAPNCSTCGYPLRWFETHNAWGCDRCQKLVQSVPPSGPIPTPVQDHPSQPYSPVPVAVRDHPSQPYSPFREPAPPPAAPPPKKSRKGVVIAAVAGLAVVGGIVAFAATREDKPERTRDAVIKQTFAALAAGDEKALFALADPKTTFTKIARCEKARTEEGSDLDRDLRSIKREQADYRDPEKIEARWKKDLAQLLRRTKGAKLEVVDILTEMPPPFGTKPKKSKVDDDEPGTDRDRERERERERYREDDEDRPEHDKEFKLTTYKKGQEVMKGCYARMPFRRQQVKVSVDVKEDDREFSQRVKVTLQEIDGEWYLSFPPTLNVGFDVVLTDLQTWRDKSCKCTDAACVEALDDDMGRLAFVQYDRESDLPKEFLTRIEKVQSERRVCEATARGGPELAKYKALKDQVCACKDEECGRKLELEMAEVRRQAETTTRGSQFDSYEVNRRFMDIQLQARDCTRKLMMTKVSVSSSYPSSGEMTGGTFVTIRGLNFTSTPRTAKVTFGTKEATTVRFVSDSEMLVEVPPADVEGFVDVRVQFDPGGLAIVPYGFTYRAPLKPIKKPKPKPL